MHSIQHALPTQPWVTQMLEQDNITDTLTEYFKPNPPTSISLYPASIEKECALCAKPLTKDNFYKLEIILTKCTHAFHSVCFNDLYKQHSNKQHPIICPTCKDIVPDASKEQWPTLQSLVHTTLKNCNRSLLEEPSALIPSEGCDEQISSTHITISGAPQDTIKSMLIKRMKNAFDAVEIFEKNGFRIFVETKENICKLLENQISLIPQNTQYISFIRFSDTFKGELAFVLGTFSHGKIHITHSERLLDPIQEAKIYFTDSSEVFDFSKASFDKNFTLSTMNPREKSITLLKAKGITVYEIMTLQEKQGIFQKILHDLLLLNKKHIYLLRKSSNSEKLTIEKYFINNEKIYFENAKRIENPFKFAMEFNPEIDTNYYI